MRINNRFKELKGSSVKNRGRIAIFDINDNSQINMISEYHLQPKRNTPFSTLNLDLKTTLIIREYNQMPFIRDMRMVKMKETMKEVSTLTISIHKMHLQTIDNKTKQFWVSKHQN